MNRRSFLKFVGLAPVVPGLAVELEPTREELWKLGLIRFKNWPEIGLVSTYNIATGEMIKTEHIYDRPRIGVKNDYSKLHTQQNQGIESV